MELDRVELESSINIKLINIKKRSITALNKNEYKKQELCLVVEKKIIMFKDFINPQFVENLQLEMNKEKEDSTTIVKLADKLLYKLHDNLTDIAIKIQEYNEKRKFIEVIPLQKYDMILGKL
ncbi:1903_t:CDS:2 [Cetraspora pellucida]|uniref:1903_t:CDS:1 n=1 Tax=Cetraspora pellucida TaxID=1433469 RepID=A0A9N9EMY7_9GLOM|nr:1903_t:CDS:2 [Cetraspora pellucida]